MTISSCTFKAKNTCNNLGLLLLTIPRAKNPEGLNLGDIFSGEKIKVVYLQKNANRSQTLEV